MDAVESCGLTYDHCGDVTVCWLDFNHDGTCHDANRTAQAHDADDGWVF